jgi:hypothetical protein
LKLRGQILAFTYDIVVHISSACHLSAKRAYEIALERNIGFLSIYRIGDHVKGRVSMAIGL